MSPSILTMGFFMSEINFCNTKEQLNHLGEVVTGKVDGSPSGADIDTSTLPYTGQVRKTLPALEAEYEQSITDKEAEADAAIDEYRLLNKGPYAAGIALESKFEYITYNGESYFATNPPYTTTATTPDADGNLFVGGYITSDFGTIDSGTEVRHRRGTNSEIMAGTPAVGELWFNTTDNSIHMGNGVTLGGIKQKDVLNVKQFGAKGDGITDDTTAIQTLIDYVEAFGSSSQVQLDMPKIFFDPGKYLTTGLLIPSHVTLEGSGRTSSVLILEKNAVSLLKRKYSSVATLNTTFRGIGLSPDDPDVNLPTGQTLFDIRGFGKSLFDDFGVYWCGGCNGISSNGAPYTASTNWYNTFVHCFVERLASWPSGGTGWYIGSNDTAFQQSTTWTWIGGRTSGAGDGICFNFEGCSTMNLFGHTIEGGSVYVGSDSGDRTTRAVIFHSAYAEAVTNFEFRNSTEYCGILGGRITGVTVSDTGNNNTLLLETTISMPVGNTGTAVYELVQQGARYPKVRAIGASSPTWQFESSTGVKSEILGGGDSINKAFRFFANNTADGIMEIGTLVARPAVTNTMKLGEAARLWTEVFAANGTINTSDATLKTDVRQLTDNEIEAAKALSKEVGAFQWLDSVEAKGDKARQHIGMTVQRAIEVMESFNLDPFNYGFICFDKWGDEFDEHGKMITESGQRYSFRPDQLDRFIARGLRAEIDGIKERLNIAGL